MIKTTLCECTLINMGQSPTSDSYNEFGDGIPFYQGNADFGEVNPIKKYYCNKPIKIANNNDILLSVRAPIGAVNIATETCCIGRGLCAISEKKNISYHKYLYYFLLSRNKDLNLKGTGSTFKAISKGILSELPISLPSMEEQIKTSELLDKVYSLISLRRNQINKLELLIKSQFVSMFGDPSINKKGWDVVNYEKLCSIITDGEHNTPRRTNNGIYLISARNVHNHKLQLDDVDYIDEYEYARISKRIEPRENDILISCSGSVGRVCRVNEKLKFQMVRSVALLRLREYLNPIFFEYLIDSKYTQNQIQKSINQSSQANLFQGKIKQLNAIVPPLELQNHFASIAHQVDKQKFELQKNLNELNILYNALMQKYFD